MYNYQTKHGAKWLKIFHQKAPNFFDDSDHAKFSLKDGLFSILSLINSDYQIHGRYEFLLEYSNETGFNRWMQTRFPLEVLTDVGNQSEGYEAISVS